MTATSPLPSGGSPAPDLGLDATGRLRARAHAAIPGGAHTYAKGDDQYPALSPGFIVRGSGCHVWDPDGNEYIEYAMGLRAVTLGHGYPSVVAAAAAQMALGTNFNRPAQVEVECAESLLDLIHGAEMAKFTKDGSTAVTAAVRLARAYTGREAVALCSSQPFFSYDDWAMCVTPVDAGIPPSGRELTLTFTYGDLDSARALFDEHGARIACLVLEPAKTQDPPPGYLQALLDLCHRHGALLVLDESITGFRWDLHGAQGLYGVVPDLSVFGKAMANGFALSALVGRREIMRLGGLDHDRERVFLLSTTHGAETHAMAAAIETMRIYRTEPVVDHLHRQGRRLRAGVDAAIEAHGVGGHVEVIGRPSCLLYATRDPQGRPSQSYRSLFLQEIIRRGILAPSFILSYSHSDADIDRTIEAVDGALGVYRLALEGGDAERYLVGPPSKSVYRRYN